MIDIDAVMADFAVRQAERKTEVAEEIQQLIWDDLPWVSMYFQPQIFGKNVALKDLVLSETIPQMDFMEAYMEE